MRVSLSSAFSRSSDARRCCRICWACSGIVPEVGLRGLLFELLHQFAVASNVKDSSARGRCVHAAARNCVPGLRQSSDYPFVLLRPGALRRVAALSSTGCSRGANAAATTHNAVIRIESQAIQSPQRVVQRQIAAKRVRRIQFAANVGRHARHDRARTGQSTP